MPDPIFFDSHNIYKWHVQMGTATVDSSGKNVKKTGTTNNWDTLVVCKLTKKVNKIKVKIDQTNNDRSGFSIGLISSTGLNQASGYSAGISFKYSSSWNVYPAKGDIIEFHVDEVNDVVEIWKNGQKGTSKKKPSVLTKPLYFAAHLYYQGNELTFVK